MPDIAYQNEAQVEQLLAFRETSVAYGQKDNVATADKQLAGFGIKTKADREQAAKHRRAAAEAAEAEAEDQAAADEAPKGRRAAKKATAAE
jgi:hypothetical protein